MKSTNEYILDGMKEHKRKILKSIDMFINQYSEGEINLTQLVDELNEAKKILVILDLNIDILSPQNDEIPF